MYGRREQGLISLLRIFYAPSCTRNNDAGTWSTGNCLKPGKEDLLKRAACMCGPHDVMLDVFSDFRSSSPCHGAEFEAHAIRNRGSAVEQEPLRPAEEPVAMTAAHEVDPDWLQGNQTGNDAKAAALKYEQAGRNPTFEQFLDEQYRQINGKLIGKLSREMGYDNAREVAAEAWTKACRSIHSFDPNLGSFNAWFWRIADNCKSDYGEKLRRQQRNEFGDDISDIWDESPRDGFVHYSPNPETIAVREDLEATISELGEYLMLDRTQQEILTFLLYAPEAEESAVSDSERQRQSRLRKKIDELTGLDPEEKEAVRLMRRHRSYRNVLAVRTLNQEQFKKTYRRACEKLLRLLSKEIEGNELL